MSFDPNPILDGLKPFQRDTVEYVFDRYFGPDPIDRFLVADEVGLGKTMVARGLISAELRPSAGDTTRPAAPTGLTVSVITE